MSAGISGLERVKEDPHPSEDWREMRGTIVRIGATGAGAVLAVGLLTVPPAGANGPDRNKKSERSSKVSADCFDTSGKTQGRSYSDPDGMSNGGHDKPGCTGGFNADRDGNNGCGNDSDREDDNNGRCGGRKDRPNGSTTTTTVPTDVSAAGAAKDCGGCPKDPAAGASVTDDGATVETVGAATDTSVLDANAALLPAAGASATADATAAETAVSATGSTSPAGVEAATATEPQTEVLGETLTRPSALARTGAGLGGLALLGGLLCGGGRLALLARKALRIG